MINKEIIKNRQIPLKLDQLTVHRSEWDAVIFQLK